MAYEFRLPDIGEGVVEGEIVQWLVKEGDLVKEDQPMVEIMTDKATVQIPAPRGGRIAKLHFAAGQVCPVGQTLVTIDEGGAPGARPEVPPPVKTAPSPVPPPTAPVPAPPAVPAAAPGVTGGKVLASPATRKLAREKGIEIGAVVASGPGGRVTREDVERAASGAVPPSAVPPPVAAPAVQVAPAFVRSAFRSSVTERPEERIPFRGLRRKIAEKMAESKRTAAHFTHVDEVDFTELVKLRESLKPRAEAQGIKLTYLPFIVKAVINGLSAHPTLNSVLDEPGGALVVRKYVHMGIAVQTDRGLMVPVIRDADLRGTFEIAREIQRLADAARDGTAKLEELTGSTFTITSIGARGGLFGTPVLNYPEVAILGVNRIEKRPVVVDGQIVVRDRMYLGISLDHRVIDGAVGADFLNVVKECIENPVLIYFE